MAHPSWPPPLPTEYEEPPPLPPEDEPPPLPPSDEPQTSSGNAYAPHAAWPPQRPPAYHPGAPQPRPPPPNQQWAPGQAAPGQQYSYHQAMPPQVAAQHGYPIGGAWPGYSTSQPLQPWQPPPPRNPAPPLPGSSQMPHASYMRPQPSYGQWEAYQQQPGYLAGYDPYAYSAMGYQAPGSVQAQAYSAPPAQQPPHMHQACLPSESQWAQPAHPAAMGGWSQSAAPPVPGIAPPIAIQNEVTAEELFMKPGRDKRARKLAVLLRGLPGSGKSFIAKKLRELEVEHGGEPPRIHAIDDYFVTEVEKEVEESEPGKKPRKRTVTAMEYLYEAELEDTYKQSILKAFTKTVEEGRFPFVILDAPNIRVEDFSPFYLAAQRTGYEVYVVKPLEKDPEVCFKRNIHQRDKDSICDLAALYEATPKIYSQLLVDGLFDLPKPPPEEEGAPIEEVDMEDETTNAEAAPEDGQEAKIKSRWAALEDEGGESEPAPRKKRRKRDSEAFESPAKTPPPQAARPSTASVLRKPGSAPPGKSVRWADQAPPPQGFTMGGPSAQQLEVVYYVEGLGPAQQDGPQRLSFQEQAKEHRKTEGHSFRDVLFGGRLA